MPKSFSSLGVSKLIQKTLKTLKFNYPTEIQEEAIPLILNGHNILACSRTGSGKTAAYLIPILQQLKKHSQIVGARALIILPNRELALQTVSFMKTFLKESDLRYILLLGGHDLEGQFEALSTNPDIILASPGRLMEILEHTDLELTRLEFLVVDEADYLFESQFIFQMNRIFEKLNKTRQTLLFSATMPDSLESFARAGAGEYRVVKLASEYTVSRFLDLQFLISPEMFKKAVLVKLLRDLEKNTRALVFVATHYRVEEFEELFSNCLGLKGISFYLKTFYL